MSDTAAEIVAEAERLAARDLETLTPEEIIAEAIGKPAGRQVRTGEHTFVIKEN